MSVEGKIELSEEVQLAATKRRAQIGTLMSLTLVALLALMWVVLSFSTTSFWTPNNIANLLRQGAMIAILALGETFVVITAGIDLSVGAVVGFTSVIIALLLTNGFPIWAAVIITLFVGIAIGIFHAFGISRLGLPPFIMTLATLTALRGFGLLITNGATISITNDQFTGFSRGDFLGVPNLFWMVVVVAVPAYLFLHQSRSVATSSRLAPIRRRPGFRASTQLGCYTSPILSRRSVPPSSAFCSPRASASAMRPRLKDGNCRRSPPRSSVAPAFSVPSARCTGR